MINRQRLKRIGVDVLGYLLIIAAGLTGWLPGPGGIPLLILGLSLLATNHEWAERWLGYVKRHGGNLSRKVFSDSPRTRLLIDVIGISLIALAVILATRFTRSVAHTAAISVSLASLFLLLGNRRRLQGLRDFFRNKRQ
jgi:Kef-type K+ transport system membrane component KefB